MTVTFTGEERTTQRILTGFWSFDWAFENRKGERGFPVRGICEISGRPGVGKSTLTYVLSGIFASRLGTNITLADIEDHFDAEFIETILTNVGFSGTVYNSAGEKDGDRLLDMLKKMKNTKESFHIGIVDSIGGISPISETEGNLEDSNWGRRAKLAATLSRIAIDLSISGSVSNCPYIIFYTNHVHQAMNGLGTITSGGVVKDFLATTRIRLSQKEALPDNSYAIQGKVDKNSFGLDKRVFVLFNLGGWGIHAGLTALYECLWLGLAKKDNGIIRIGDTSYGRFTKMISQPDNAELFSPFVTLMNEKAADVILKGQKAKKSENDTVSTEEDES